jgi:hypothetical protein
MRDFPGMTNNNDQCDNPPGVATEQVNVMSMNPGQITVRPGYVKVIFESDIS